MYQVFNNDEPVDSAHFGVASGIGWDSSMFNTFNEAVEYARLWLGPLYGNSADDIKLNKVVVYNDCDTIEIRQINFDKNEIETLINKLEL